MGLDFLPGALPFEPAVRPGPTRSWRRTSSGSTRYDDERRPDAAQPEPARVASAAVADRPRRRAVHPPHLARSGRTRPAAVRRDPRPRAAAVRGLDRRRRRPPGAADRPGVARRHRRAHPGRVARAELGLAGPGAQRARLRRLPGRAPRGAARRSWRRRTVPVPREPFEYAIVRVVPRVERGEAFNAGIVAVLAGRTGSWARATELDERRLDGARAGTATRDLSGRTSRRSRGSRPEPRRPAPSRRSIGGAIPLARGAVVDDHPAVRGPHGADRRSGSEA